MERTATKPKRQKMVEWINTQQTMKSEFGEAIDILKQTGHLHDSDEEQQPIQAKKPGKKNFVRVDN